MKKIFTLVFISFICHTAFSQSERYVPAMKKNISQLDSIGIKNNAAELANNFQRVADAEKTQWLPYYYAAYLTAYQALTTQDNSIKDEMADKANSLLESAQKILAKDNSEIYVIKAMIATAHMTVDPQNRYMTYGQEISNSLKKAEALDSTNPRPVLLQAQNLYFTPEFAGGGKDIAKPLFEKAKELFASFKPANELSPDWGKASLDFFLKNYE
jgi:hypothetical protein